MPRYRQPFSRSELTALLSNKSSYVTIKPAEFSILVHPYFYPNNIKNGIQKALDNKRTLFNNKLGGIIMGYARIVVDLTKGKLNGPYPEYPVNCDCYVFEPFVGCVLKGTVNKVSRDHIGCLVHKILNATIFRPEDEDYEIWINRPISYGQEIYFTVKDVDYTQSIPYIEGVVSQYDNTENEGEGSSDGKATTKTKKKLKMQKKNKPSCISSTQLQIQSPQTNENDFDCLSPIPRVLSPEHRQSTLKKQNAKKLGVVDGECKPIFLEDNYPAETLKKKKKDKSQQESSANCPTNPTEIIQEKDSIMDTISRVVNDDSIVCASKSIVEKKAKRKQKNDSSTHGGSPKKSFNAVLEIKSDDDDEYEDFVGQILKEKLALCVDNNKIIKKEKDTKNCDKIMDTINGVILKDSCDSSEVNQGKLSIKELAILADIERSIEPDYTVKSSKRKKVSDSSEKKNAVNQKTKSKINGNVKGIGSKPLEVKNSKQVKPKLKKSGLKSIPSELRHGSSSYDLDSMKQGDTTAGIIENVARDNDDLEDETKMENIAVAKAKAKKRKIKKDPLLASPSIQNSHESISNEKTKSKPKLTNARRSKTPADPNQLIIELNKFVASAKNMLKAVKEKKDEIENSSMDTDASSSSKPKLTNARRRKTAVIPNKLLIDGDKFEASIQNVLRAIKEKKYEIKNSTSDTDASSS